MSIRLEDLVGFTQKKLQNFLRGMFKDHVAYRGEFILVPGDAPVMLVAHMDTVHKEPVRVICETDDGNVLMSPQGIGGDDRCGVYALITAYEKSKVKPWLLFTCDEEIGCVGARAFAARYECCELPEDIILRLDGLKMIIEIDRRGSLDAVYYGCANAEFENYVTSKGFKTNYGSYSDICEVAPMLGVAAVNLSSGYYYEHHLNEYIVRSEIDATIEKVISMVADSTSEDFPKYEYVPERPVSSLSFDDDDEEMEKFCDAYNYLLSIGYPEEQLVEFLTYHEDEDLIKEADDIRKMEEDLERELEAEEPSYSLPFTDDDQK